MTHVYIDNLAIIVSDNGLSPGRCQAIIWNNTGIFLIGPLGIIFSQILIEIITFLFDPFEIHLNPVREANALPPANASKF